jgi:glycosyltransferase involved in cell wall biosynthesis
VNSLVDIGIANSSGSFDDLSSIIDRRKIVVRQHSVDENYFVRLNNMLLRKKYGFGEDDFVLLFVGYLNYEKTFDVFLNVALRLLNKRIPVKLLIIGDGPLKELVVYLSQKYRNVFYEGPIYDPLVLHEFYSIADLTWAYADETYLANPAVESLASGTPIIVPDTPAVLRKRIKGIRITSALFPPQVGFTVKHDSLEEIVNKITFLYENRVLLKDMRNNAYLYALKEHSTHKHKIIAALIIYYHLTKSENDKYSKDSFRGKSRTSTLFRVNNGKILGPINFICI